MSSLPTVPQRQVRPLRQFLAGLTRFAIEASFFICLAPPPGGCASFPGLKEVGDAPQVKKRLRRIQI